MQTTTTLKKYQLLPENVEEYPSYFFFLVVSFPVLLGTVFPEWGLFKLSLSLPFLARLGTIPGHGPAVFLFEIYLACLSFILVPRFLINHPVEFLRKNRSLYAGLLSFLFGFWAIYFSLTVRENIIFSLRNSAFLWYLWLPLVLWLGRVPFAAIKATVFLASVLVVYPLLRSICIEETIVWTPHIGLYSLLFLTLTYGRKVIWIPLLFLISLALALSFKGEIQRTSMLGNLFVIGFAFWWTSLKKRFLLRLLGFLFLTFLGVAVFRGALQNYTSIGVSKPDPTSLKVPLELSNPFLRAETGGQGIDVFRRELWKDAFGLFLQNPLVGIGFEKQVVYRIFQWNDQYVPNDFNWAKALQNRQNLNQPPISGPHNGYLNALARVGIVGSLLLLLHLWCLFFYLSKDEILCASVFFSHMLYAFFNVGLEGPIRSALLLMLLSGPLLLSREKKHDPKKLKLQTL